MIALAVVVAGIGAAWKESTWAAAKPLTHADIEGKKSTAVFAEISFRF